MKVILKDYVPNVGGMGDVVEVADGYGRNYLVPRGLAVRANTENLSKMEHEKAAIELRRSRMHEDAVVLAEKLNGFECVIEKAVGENGKLYGSVTSMDLEDRLHEAGFTSVDRRQIVLGQPVKELCDMQITVKVHPEVSAEFKLSVVARGDA
jgi:large subunit ribosomal protein L9